MERGTKQPTFTDMTLSELGSPKAKAFFDACLREIPFERLAASLPKLFANDGPNGGASNWSVLVMLKILFLQKVFGLSDPMTEEMLKDRISFRRFVGLSHDDDTPDDSVISVFRKRLRDNGCGATLFEESLAILREKGKVLNTGTLIDATIIEAPLGGKRADGSNSGDPLASKTVKGGRTYHGFRAHIATDRAGIITDYIYDTARVSEHTHFDDLAAKEQKAVFADSGCRSKDRVERLRQRGVVAGLCHRRVRGQKELTPQQKRLNRLIAPIRAFVEHPLGWIKGRLNNRRCRYRGLARNAFDFCLSAIACNFCRALKLQSIAR
jgi:IS5 family transposase